MVCNSITFLPITPISDPFTFRTGTGDDEFDTDDWKIPGGTANGTSSYAAFNRILDLASKLSTGFIVLEHDLYQQTVEMAIGYFLPLAKTRSFTVSLQCISRIAHVNSSIHVIFPFTM